MRRLSACTRVPHREGDAMGGFPSFDAGNRNKVVLLEASVELVQ